MGKDQAYEGFAEDIMDTRILTVFHFYTKGVGWWEEWSKPVYDTRSAKHSNDSLHNVKRLFSGGQYTYTYW